MSDVRPLESARRKVDHAKWHINRMNRAINVYGNSKPCSVVSQPELDQVPRLRLRIEPPPVEISLALGDSLGCMRAALDHIAWGFADGAGTISTKFPITQPERVPLTGTSIKVPSGKGILKYGGNVTDGWSDAAVDFVRAHNPSQGDAPWWQHPLVVLNMMVNADKHQMIRMVSTSTASIRYKLIKLEVEGGVDLLGEADGSSVLNPTFAQALENGDEIQVFEFAAGQKLGEVDIQPVATVQLTAEGWPTEEIGFVMIRCHEAVNALVASAESGWDQLVPENAE